MPGQPTRTRYIQFVVVLLVGCLFVAIVAAEIILRYRQVQIMNSDQRTPGMIDYDPLLGWRLAPNWSGSHHHKDFDVKYVVNRYGFRGAVGELPGESGQMTALVGDSFTFSYGATEGETFIDRLNNSRLRGSRTYYNFGVPGYSTDQELLLIRERVLAFDPYEIILVVYLYNDIIDNTLAFPMQANHGKPYFTVDGQGLLLHNSPVPRDAVPAEKRPLSPASLLLDNASRKSGWLERQLGRFKVTRRLVPLVSTLPDISPQLNEALADNLILFRALVDEIHRLCRENSVRFSLLLMPGRSYVEQSNSLSAIYQEYLRRQIHQSSGVSKPDVLDLASHLRATYLENGKPLYHPNEGHLNKAGHEAIADYLNRVLD